MIRLKSTTENTKKAFLIAMENPTPRVFNTHFCLLLANRILEMEARKGANFVASPLSLHVILSLIAAGSKGHTLEQLLFFLRSNNVCDLNSSSSQIITLTSPDHASEENQTGGPLLSFVNGAWLDQRFCLKPSFEEIVKSSYKAEIKNVDFLKKADEAVDEVNSWAEKATKGLIKQLLSSGSLDSKTVLVLANALYFKGSWDKKFDGSRTETRDFHLLDNQTVQASFMTTEKDEEHQYKCFDGFKVVKIPYQSGQDLRKFTMYIFLPDEKDGLLNLIQMLKLNPDLLTQQYYLLEDRLPEFWIPKFKFSFEFEASEIMKELGLTLPFQPGDLTEIVDSQSSDELYVSSIVHKAFIEVNEEGTEAAAVTDAACSLVCFREPPRFVADYPFLFMIREETHKAVFFIGSVLNPLQDS